MSHVSRTATFNPGDAPGRILEDLACPACGHDDPGHAQRPIGDNKMRIFCDCCGAFITIALSDEQAQAIHRLSITVDEVLATRHEPATRP